jgi:nucleotide-binding universal stress UspA family protein
MSPTIVCGIDASAGAHAALEVAATLARRLGLRLVLVHAVPAPTPDLLLTPRGRVPAHVDGIDLLERELGERLLEDAAELHGVPLGDRRLDDGPAAERLRAIAREEQAELIVVGSRGAGTLNAAILGSVSTAVVRHAPCPIVVVPPGMTEPALVGERITCGVHGREDGPTVRTAARLADRLDVPLTLCHVLPSGARAAELVPVAAGPLSSDDRYQAASHGALRSALRLLEDAEEDVSPGPHGLWLRRGDPADELLALADSTEAMLLVVGSRGRGPLRSSLFGSVSRELVHRAACPVVICPHGFPA